MTEFEHVTTELIEVNGVRMNLSTDKIWVNTVSNEWEHALWKIETFVLEAIEKHGPKNRRALTAKFILDKYFSDKKQIKSPEYWNKILSEASEIEKIELEKTCRTERFKPMLMQFFGFFLNHGCILLPFVGGKSAAVPAWHGPHKPAIEREPYIKITQRVLEKHGSDRRYRPVLRTLFCSIEFDDVAKINAEVYSEFKKSNYYLSIGEKFFKYYMRVFRVINDIALESGGDWLQTHNVKLGSLTRTKLSEHFLNELKTINIKESDYWKRVVEDWLCSLPHQTLKFQLRSCLIFLNWLKAQGLDHFTALDIQRRDLLRNDRITRVKKTFFEEVEELGTVHARYKTNYDIVELFNHIYDEHNDVVENNDRLQCPFRENDKSRFLSYERKHSKSARPVLPKTIMEDAKDILLKDDYAWAREQSCNWFIDSNAKEQFCPALTIGLYTLLTIPIRTIQMALLDSGEADERIINDTLNLVKNAHALAKKNRSEGCLRQLQPHGSAKPFVGFYINSNKTAIDAQNPGYEIPFHEPKLIEQLLYLRNWQLEHNPVSKLTDRSELTGKWRYQGNIENLCGYTFLFRNPEAKKTGPWHPFHPSDYNKYWRLLLREVQMRLAAKGTAVSLIEVDEKTSPNKWKTPYTLHSLRMSGITHFIEAGVPLHVLAEFVAGHATLIMTLYYTKLGPHKVNSIIQEAADRLTQFEEDEYLQELTEMFENGVSSLVGHDIGLRYASEGDPGIWQIELDGICVAGRALCHEGGETTNIETGDKNTVPIRPDGFNCGRCKFHVTGPAFLAGQVTMINTLLYSLQDADNRRQKLFEMRDKAEEARNKKRVVRLNGDCEKIELEITEKLVTLAARLSNLYASHDLMNSQEERNPDCTALITKLSPDELQVRVEETRQSELVSFVANAVEFFPSIPDTGAKVRQHLLFRKMAQENGMDSLLLRLSEEESGVAALHASNMLYQILARDEYCDLMEGRKKLEDLGILKHDLREICDVAIERVKNRNLESKDVKIGGNPGLIEMEVVGSADCSDIRNQACSSRED